MCSTLKRKEKLSDGQMSCSVQCEKTKFKEPNALGY